MARSVAKRVFGVGRAMGATRKELLAAAVTGLVESNFTNPSGGDRDSAGWRQERAMYYKNPTNVEASARRFFKELRAQRGKGYSVGELAQAVQRSAFPAKYGQRLGEGRRLLGASGGTRSMGASGGTRTITTPGGVDKLAALREALLSGGKNPLLRAKYLVDSGAFSYGPMSKTIQDRRRTRPPARSDGRVVVAAGANRKGTPVSSVLLAFSRRAAAEFGEKFTLTTGTNHKQYTTTGNVSDHWDGHGGDFAAEGERLTRMGRAALRAAGMPAKKANRIKGGAFTLRKNGRRIQIIFNSNVGGNHYNHLHIGVR